MSGELNCQECGACCSNPRDRRWIEVSLTDAERLGQASLLQPGDIEAYAMRQEPCGRCVALEGKIGESCACGVYPLRPEICRKVQPGDALCLLLRRQHGLEP